MWAKVGVAKSAVGKRRPPWAECIPAVPLLCSPGPAAPFHLQAWPPSQQWGQPCLRGQGQSWLGALLPNSFCPAWASVPNPSAQHGTRAAFGPSSPPTPSHLRRPWLHHGTGGSAEFLRDRLCPQTGQGGCYIPCSLWRRHHRHCRETTCSMWTSPHSLWDTKYRRDMRRRWLEPPSRCR